MWPSNHKTQWWKIKGREGVYVTRWINMFQTMPSKQNVPTFPMPVGHLRTVELLGLPDFNGQSTYRDIGRVKGTGGEWGYQMKPSLLWDWSSEEWAHCDRVERAEAAVQAGKSMALFSCLLTPPGCQPGSKGAQVTQTHRSASWGPNVAEQEKI